MQSMQSAATGTGSFASWDVSKVKDFSSMFKGGASFNQDISSWDVRKGEKFDSMFEGALVFNQDLSKVLTTNDKWTEHGDGDSGFLDLCRQRNWCRCDDITTC